MLDAEEIAAFIPSTNDNVEDPPRISRASRGRTEEARITLAFEARTHGIGAGFLRTSLKAVALRARPPVPATNRP